MKEKLFPRKIIQILFRTRYIMHLIIIQKFWKFSTNNYESKPLIINVFFFIIPYNKGKFYKYRVQILFRALCFCYFVAKRINSTRDFSCFV